MTIQEARRAQDYLDHEVIIGSLRKQWAIVRNGVDRKVSLAIGFGFYKAVVASQRGATRDVLVPLVAPTKRNHDDHSLNIVHHTVLSFNPSKRVKSDMTASTSSSQASPIDDRSPWMVLDRSSDGSSEAQEKRHTRFSGLQVEFVPKSWNQVSERKHRRVNEGESLEPSKGSTEFPYEIDTP